MGKYFHMILPPKAAVRVWTVRFVKISFLLGNVLVIVALWQNPRRWLPANGIPVAIFMAGCVHLSYLATATVESGLERYVAPSWPLLLATTACIVLHNVSGELRRRRRAVDGLNPHIRCGTEDLLALRRGAK